MYSIFPKISEKCYDESAFFSPFCYAVLYERIMLLLTLSTMVAALDALTVMETIARVIPTAATTKT